MPYHIRPWENGHWTGVVFAKIRKAIALAEKFLYNTAVNFYINDKPTGAVVGQQPFCGARASGTDRRTGSHLNLIRWMSAQAIKENHAHPGIIDTRSWRKPKPFLLPERSIQ